LLLWRMLLLLLLVAGIEYHLVLYDYLLLACLGLHLNLVLISIHLVAAIIVAVAAGGLSNDSCRRCCCCWFC